MSLITNSPSNQKSNSKKFHWTIAQWIKFSNYEKIEKEEKLFDNKSIILSIKRNDNKPLIVNIRLKNKEICSCYASCHIRFSHIKKKHRIDFTEKHNYCSFLKLDLLQSEIAKKRYLSAAKELILDFEFQFQDDSHSPKKSVNKIVNKDNNVLLNDNENKIKYVGIKNQGSTCYINSFFQVLFHLSAFRKFIYQIPTDNIKNKDKSIFFQIQLFFSMLQTSNEPVETNKLTKSLGWNYEDVLQQQDVHEFCHILFSYFDDNLKDKNTTISDLFKGKIRSFVKCKNVNFETKKNEDFFDLSLMVKGCSNLNESFLKYLETEELSGDNQYNTEIYGNQDAIIGTEFVKFPPILQIHLRRFEYKPKINKMIKINSYLSFPTEMDISDYLSDENEHKGSRKYILFGVIVHQGQPSFGHYYSFLHLHDKWYKFNDSVVSVTTEEKVFSESFGGKTTNKSIFGALANQFLTVEKSYNAYMLIYIQKSEMNNVFHEITFEDIPACIRKQIKGNSILETNHLISVYLFSHKQLCFNASIGIIGFQKNTFVENEEIPLNTKVPDFYELLSNKYKYKYCRIWQFNQNFVPTFYLDQKRQTFISNFSQKYFYIEELNNPDNNQKQTLIFIYFYFPRDRCPLQFIYSYPINYNDNLNIIITDIIKTIQCNPKTKLIPYIRKQDNFIEVDVMKNISTLFSRDSLKSIIFTFDDIETEYNYQPFQAFSEGNNSKKRYFLQEMPLSKIYNLTDYMRLSSDLVCFHFLGNINNKIINTIYCPSLITMNEFKKYISKIICIDFDISNDQMLFFHPKILHPINTNDFQTVGDFYSHIKEITSNKTPRIITSVYPNSKDKNISNIVHKMIYFSNNGYTTCESIRVFIKKNYTFKHVLDLIKDEIKVFELSEEDAIRCLCFENNYIKSIHSLDDNIDINCDYIRFEKIPHDQINVKDGLMQIVLCERKDNNLRIISKPFLFKLNEGESFLSFSKRLFDEKIVTTMLSNENQITKYENDEFINCPKNVTLSEFSKDCKVLYIDVGKN